VQLSLSAAAKQGDPQALAALLNKSLAAQGVAVKAMRQGDRLHLLLEAASLPPRDALLRFLKQSLTQLQPEAIALVSVQARTCGLAEIAWQSSFRLAAAASPSDEQLNSALLVQRPVGRSIRYQAKPKQPKLTQALLELLASRNGERCALILLTFLLTSGFWGLLGSGSADPGAPLLGSSAAPWNRRTLRGRLVLVDREIADAGDRCYGTGGYDDVAANMRVTVRDGRGNILATGATGNGSRPVDPALAPLQCVFEFRVDVPLADFYSITVGRRGEISYSRDELRSRRWQVSLTLDP